MDRGADIRILCRDLLGIELNAHERHPGYFVITYIISYKDMLMIPSGFVGVDGLTVECQAKTVSRQSLPNVGKVVSIFIDQRVFPSPKIF